MRAIMNNKEKYFLTKASQDDAVSKDKPDVITEGKLQHKINEADQPNEHGYHWRKHDGKINKFTHPAPVKIPPNDKKDQKKMQLREFSNLASMVNPGVMAGLMGADHGKSTGNLHDTHIKSIGEAMNKVRPVKGKQYLDGLNSWGPYGTPDQGYPSLSSPHDKDSIETILKPQLREGMPWDKKGD